MEQIFVDLFSGIITSAWEAINGWFTDVLLNIFYIENFIDGLPGGVNIFSTIGSYITNVGLSLIVLKFVHKLFMTYFLGTDGDPDAEIKGLLMRFIKAIAIALCFSYLYDFLINVTIDITSRFLTNSLYNYVNQVDAVISGLSTSVSPMFTVLCLLVVVIAIIVIVIQLFMRGLQMWVIRIGMPLFCVGILDSDGGLFRSATNILIKSVVTVVIQFSFLIMGITYIGSSIFTQIFGIICLVTAIASPKLMSEIMIQAGGERPPVTGAVRAASMIKNIAR
jgi:hypothetical protein